jgi:hypothetical protein
VLLSNSWLARTLVSKILENGWRPRKYFLHHCSFHRVAFRRTQDIPTRCIWCIFQRTSVLELGVLLQLDADPQNNCYSSPSNKV